MRCHRVRVLFGVATAAAAFAACAVIPTYSASTSTFEGFPVISYVPAAQFSDAH